MFAQALRCTPVPVMARRTPWRRWCGAFTMPLYYLLILCIFFQASILICFIWEYYFINIAECGLRSPAGLGSIVMASLFNTSGASSWVEVWPQGSLVGTLLPRKQKWRDSASGDSLVLSFPFMWLYLCVSGTTQDILGLKSNLQNVALCFCLKCRKDCLAGEVFTSCLKMFARAGDVWAWLVTGESVVSCQSSVVSHQLFQT